jgi:hypothetical protein
MVERLLFGMRHGLTGVCPRILPQKYMTFAKGKIGPSQKLCMTTNGSTSYLRSYLTQFVLLWALIQNVDLSGEDDDIFWKLTTNGQYSAASVYKLQFFGLMESPLNNLVWKAWAPPKVKNGFGRRID